jgi:hypothetical protein
MKTGSSFLPHGALVLLALFTLGLGGCFDDDGGSDDSDAPSPAASSQTLSITPIAQQTELWCWAASAEMIFRHYGLPNLNPSGNYQCGIVAVYFGPASPCWFNCFQCVTGGGLMSQIKVLIDGYGTAARQLGLQSRVLSSSLLFAPLSFNETAEQIDAGQPILAGISPQGYAYPNVSEHAVVIVGYQSNTAGQRLIINDPFPYAAFPTSPNPYFAAGGTALQPGRYSIPYATFVSTMNWANSITNIR